MQVTDFMPVSISGEEEFEEEQHELYRLVEVTKGSLDVQMIFEPRFDYARAETELNKLNGGIVASGGGYKIGLSSNRELVLEGQRAVAMWRLSEGDRVWLHLTYEAEDLCTCDTELAAQCLQDTETYWRSWLSKSETGRTVDLGPYEKMVNRSALVLKLLYYNPTGTIAAAATTSLPEEIGGARNWDYRYTWVRDTSFTLQALFNLGHLSETEGFLRWTEKLLAEHGADKMQIMYGLRGEEELPEEELDHFDGYKGSRPVRIGNQASKQRQLDIYGELMDAALKLSDYVGKIDAEIWSFLRNVCDYVVEHWRDKDSGIWEVRGGPYHFVYSKVMCWLAMDRGLTIARRYGFTADLKKWEKTRDKIKQEVLKKGWNEEKKTFVQHYETNALDASNLLLPILGFLSHDDRRVLSTIEAIRRELGHNGFVYRYKAEDGLSGDEGAFLLCTFWLIDSLIVIGRYEEAELLLQRMEDVSNHLGLFSEEYNPEWKEALGNFPQAFTHIGYINSVIALCQVKGLTVKEEGAEVPKPLLVSGKVILNEGDPVHKVEPREIASKLKNSMNILRGAFFDTKRGRVAYEKMSGSMAYKEYLELSYSLRDMDLGLLSTRQEQLAFWINLYNVIIIHGVIALGIRDSVKEVRNFFRRIQYRIGDMFFSPQDIEHGILRGNSRPPNSIFKLFRGADKRLSYSIKPSDPRVHFALVCASSSCPPIGVYTAENMDSELDLAARTFLNAGGLKIDREGNRLLISSIFRWYDADFGKSQAERLNFIVRFLNKKEDREFLEKNAETVKVVYQDYDWRLNRY
jgi:GH15 family glucan-1,4-alpha-glucosidase